MDNQKNTLARAVSGSLIAAGAVTALGWAARQVGLRKIAHNLTHPKFDRTVDGKQLGDLPYENFSIENPRDQIRIHATLLDPGNTDQVVIIGHGYGGNRFSHKLNAALAKKLYEEGYAICLLDYRNSGKSDDGITTIGGKEKYDTNAISLYLEQRGFTRQEAFGGSAGGVTSILASADNPLFLKVGVETAHWALQPYLEGSSHKWLKRRKALRPVMPLLTTKAKETGEEQLRPRLLKSLFRVVKSQGVDLSEAETYRAVESLKEEGVPIDYWTHVNDQMIPPEHNTGKLAKIHGQLHEFDGEPRELSPNGREKEYHTVGYNVKGDEFVDEVASKLKEGFQQNLNREQRWIEQGKADWREKLFPTLDFKPRSEPRFDQPQPEPNNERRKFPKFPGAEKFSKIPVIGKRRNHQEPTQELTGP